MFVQLIIQSVVNLMFHILFIFFFLLFSTSFRSFVIIVRSYSLSQVHSLFFLCICVGKQVNLNYSRDHAVSDGLEQMVR